MPVAPDSSPLMWLSKVGRLTLLKLLYGRVTIPQEVYEETIERGVAEGFSDALVIKEAMEEGWLETSTLMGGDKELCRRILEHAPEIHIGEAQAILMARRAGLPLLIDEAGGRALAEAFGLKVNGTVYVILRGLKEGYLKREEAREAMFELVEKGFRIEPRLLSRILRAVDAYKA